MSREGLSMRKVREILRLKLHVGLSARKAAKSCKVSTTTVTEYEKRAKEAGLTWPLPEDMDDDRLERIVRGGSGSSTPHLCLPFETYSPSDRPSTNGYHRQPTSRLHMPTRT